MVKLSQFTVAKPLDAHGLADYTLIYSLRTGKSTVMKQQDWENLSLEPNATGSAGRTRAAERMSRLGIFVDAELDERDDLLSDFDDSRWRPQRIYPILAVTTGCNIGCTYCYESGTTASTMSLPVADAVADWVIQRMKVDRIPEVHPSLFGGEPLLYPKLLFRLMDRINAAARELGTMVTYSCSSNGLFMTPGLARDLFRRRMTQIQISLDGTKFMHDIRRAGKRGQSTYDGSLAGILAAAEFIPNVTLKVNFDRQNIETIAPLFDDLKEAGLAGRIDVKLEAIARQFSDSRVAHDPAHVIAPESVEMADSYVRLQLEAETRGFTVRRDTAHTTPCMVTSHHGVIIGPDGMIYKCISMIGRPDYAVGNVFDESYDQDAYSAEMNVRKKTEQCFEENCPYVPVCFGGCGYEAAVRGGKSTDRFCTFTKLDRYHFLKMLTERRDSLEAIGVTPLTPKALAGCGSGPCGCHG